MISKSNEDGSEEAAKDESVVENVSDGEAAGEEEQAPELPIGVLTGGQIEEDAVERGPHSLK